MKTRNKKSAHKRKIAGKQPLFEMEKLNVKGIPKDLSERIDYYLYQEGKS